MSETVKVTAPADLQEGYTFDAQVEGKTFKVTVPSGGVKAGEEIVVPYPHDTAAAVPATGASTGGAGDFNTGLCDCCETCPCPFFMAWCCHGIFSGQVLQRLKLNPLGMPGGGYENTCMIMTAIWIVVLVVWIVLGYTTNGIGSIIYGVFGIYMLVALTLARNYFRTKFNIQGSACGDSCLDDCCCIFWCGCCSIIQMSRHSHDEKSYGYEMTTKTGLSPNAPEIV